MMRKLTEKQEAFCRAFIETGEKSEAYRKAYDAEKMSDQVLWNNAHKLGSLPHVIARIDELKAEREKRLNINADYVLRRLVEIDQMDVLDILTDDGGMRPISEWPKCWRTTLSGLDISTQIVNGDALTIENILKKIKWPDKVKNLELIGKHVRVGAFKDTIDHTSSDGSMTPTVIQLVGPADDDGQT